MKLLAAVLAIVIAVIGAVGVASPSFLMELARPLLSPGALYVVAALRVLFGVALVAAASSSRMPRIVRALGLVLIVLGVLTPFFGVERSQATFEWWSKQPLWFMRAWSSLAIIFGGFVIYALRSPSRAPA